jgi:hypothetical protein
MKASLKMDAVFGRAAAKQGGMIVCGLAIFVVLAAWSPATGQSTAAGTEQAPAQAPGTGPAPVPTSAQPGMTSQVDRSRAVVLSQDEIHDAPIVRGAPLPHGEGARRMGARLKEIFDSNDWRADPAKPFERIPYYQMLLTKKLRLPDEIMVRMELGNEQLRAGFSARAIDTLEDLVRLVNENLDKVPVPVQAQLHQQLGLSYLRLAEQENCVAMHNPDACLFPLHGGGLHKKLRGAEGAVREYTKALELNPNNYTSMWLMNIAYQALGRWPQDVPKQWLADPDRFKSEYDIGFFPEVAGIAGIHNEERAGGAIVEDFEGNGLLDILISSQGPLDHMHYYHNNGDGTFTDRTREAGLEDEIGGLNIVETDYNNDGKPDFMILRGAWWRQYGAYPFSLMRNNGDGTFDDVTEEAGLLTLGPTQTAAWADYDGDGWLDLFVGHETVGGHTYACQLFHNNHDGTFTQVKAPGAAPGKLGVNLGFVKGATWGDYNNDGRPDLYLSTMSGRSFLFRNDGPADPAHPDPANWKFTDVTVQAGLAGKRFTFPTWFFDYDNDGWLDIFAGGFATASTEDYGAFEFGLPNHGEVSHLFHNNRDGTFTEVPHAGGLDRAITVMAANFGDLDNDGWLDVYLGLGDSYYESLLPKRMFRNDRGRYFQDVTWAGDFGNLQKGHGISFADIENNGSEDVFEELGGAYPGDRFVPVLYKNPGHGNHWISLKLEGVKTNRAAFGARIRVTILENGVERSIYRAVGSTSSFGGNPMREHIGVGKAAVVKEMEIWWPVPGERQHFKNVAVDRNYRVVQGRDLLEPVVLKEFEIGKTKIAEPLHDQSH